VGHNPAVHCSTLMNISYRNGAVNLRLANIWKSKVGGRAVQAKRRA